MLKNIKIYNLPTNFSIGVSHSINKTS